MKRLYGFLVAFAYLSVVAVSARAATITITSPKAYSVWQRSSNGLGPIPITGRYTGTPSPTTIQARFAGGTWTLIDSNPANGNFSGTLHHQPTGDGTLEVRFGNFQSVTGSVANVAVGDVYLITGQSNALGQGNTLNTIDPLLPTFASAFRETDDAWAIADDPVCDGGLGSPWPLLANEIIAQSSVPIGFISVAQSGQSLLKWAPTQPMYVRVFDQIDKATAGTNRIKAVLWFQGEADMLPSSDGSTLNGSQSEYHLALKKFADTVHILPGNPKVVVGQSNFNTPDSSFANLIFCGNIRAAQSDLWDDAPNSVLSGPVTYDIALSDNLHFKTDGEMQQFADRWWAAVHMHFYGGTDGLGPKLSSAQRFGTSGTQILLTFTHQSAALGPIGSPLGGFTFNDPSNQCTSCLSAVVLGNDTVLVTKSSAFTLPAAISLGLGKTAWGQNVPVDGAELPAVPFRYVLIDP